MTKGKRSIRTTKAERIRSMTEGKRSTPISGSIFKKQGGANNPPKLPIKISIGFFLVYTLVGINIMKKFSIICLSFFLFSCMPNLPTPPYAKTLSGQTFSLELATNNVQRQIGLMWREHLPETVGMLFVFENPALHSFWMKNTLIPLDIVWISESNQIVDIKTVLPCPPDENCQSFSPKKPAKYVLEVNAGQFKGEINEKIEFFF